MQRRQQLGKWGEQVAASYLEARGWDILQRNWRCRHGEIDLIARDGQTLVFVEVRTRSTLQYGTAAESVNWRKQQKLRQLALHYLAANQTCCPSFRFDVVTLFRQEKTGQLTVSHYPHAF